MLNRFFFFLGCLNHPTMRCYGREWETGFVPATHLLLLEFTNIWAAFLSLCSRRISHDLAHHSAAFVLLQCSLPSSYLLVLQVGSNILIPSQHSSVLWRTQNNLICLCLPSLPVPCQKSLEIISIGACEAGEWRILQGTGASTSTGWTAVRMMSVHSSLHTCFFRAQTLSEQSQRHVWAFKSFQSPTCLHLSSGGGTTVSTTHICLHFIFRHTGINTDALIKYIWVACMTSQGFAYRNPGMHWRCVLSWLAIHS